MTNLAKLRVKIFADGADLAGMRALYANPLIRGFTTNPTLMRKAGVTDYEAFAREVLTAIPDRPISFEVFSDDFDDMRRQALKIAGWGDNVNVKIPVTNTRGESSTPLIRDLVSSGLKLNVTAVFTLRQVWEVTRALMHGPGGIVSVFAGRIADAGVDPVPHMAAALEMVKTAPGVELLWASPREVLNIIQADAIGCHIITVTPDILKKLATVGMGLEAFSLDTVKMFYDDGKAVGFKL
jgi:transaldolase